MAFQVVFICTANRCRSPYAEQALTRLVRHLPVEVRSAGTLNAPDRPTPPELIELAAGADIDLRRHGARPLAQNRLEEADLVVGFELSHVASAVVEGGADKSKTFMLRELTRLLTDVPESRADDVAQRAREMVGRADQARSGAPFAVGDEIADPFGGSRRAYTKMIEDIDRHIEVLAPKLFGIPRA